MMFVLAIINNRDSFLENKNSTKLSLYSFQNFFDSFQNLFLISRSFNQTFRRLKLTFSSILFENSKVEEFDLFQLFKLCSPLNESQLFTKLIDENFGHCIFVSVSLPRFIERFCFHLMAKIVIGNFMDPLQLNPFDELVIL